MGFETPVTNNSRLANASLSWLQICDVDHGSFDSSNEFILSTFVHDTTPHSGTASILKLQWRRAGGIWYDVSATSEVCWGTGTVLVDATTPVTTSAGCQTNDQSMENEGDNLCSLPKVGSGLYGEVQWALGFGTGFAYEQQYDFRIYDTTVIAALAQVDCQLTTGTAPVGGAIDTLLSVSWANIDSFMGIEDTSIDEVMGIDTGE